MRRWIDSGEIRISRTAGGHRRIPVSEAVQFIRKMGAVVVRPEVLNLPPLPDAQAASSHEGEVSDEQRLFAALQDGHLEVARGLVLSWYLAGSALHELFDGPLRGAMHRLGELWQHDERGILIEHRATGISLNLIAGLRALLSPPQDSAPLAMGGAPAGDPYQMPSLMAATTLAEAGLRDVNFGPDTPLKLLADEALRSRARIVWLSISAVADARSLRAAVRSLADALAEQNIPLVIGGHASAGIAPRKMLNVHGIGSMSELAAFARGVLSRSAR